MPQRSPGPVDADPRRPHLLLVDDLPANLHTLAAALRDDHVLSVATSGQRALELAEADRPDLMLLDVMMPVMDGLEVLTRLRDQPWGAELPVVLITADDRTELQVRGLDQGADDFIAKPIVVPVLRARVRNVLERYRLRRELVRLATTDALTGACNRRRFFELLEHEHQLVVRYHQPCGLLMVDLDRFKAVNDRHGHAVGDAVLVGFATTVTDLLREVDTLARLGGEEFAVLLPRTGPQGTQRLAERLRSTVAGAPVPGVTRPPVQLTVSIGVTELLAEDLDVDVALRRADVALYAAKHDGRNRVARASTGAPQRPERLRS